MKELTPNKWRNLLHEFVADAEEMRPVMMKPFEQDGYVCATDAHILIRVAKRFISDDYTTDKSTPNVTGVIPDYNPQYTVTVNNLRGAFVQRGIDYDNLAVECPYCDDDCEVEWTFEDHDGDTHTMWAECPCCAGTGYVANGINHYFEIKERTVNAHFMLILYQTMIELGIDRAEVTIIDMQQILFTIADGIDIIIMPYILNNKRNKGISRVKISKL